MWKPRYESDKDSRRCTLDRDFLYPYKRDTLLSSSYCMGIGSYEISNSNDTDLAQAINDLWQRNQDRWKNGVPSSQETTVAQAETQIGTMNPIPTEVGARGAAIREVFDAVRKGK